MNALQALSLPLKLTLTRLILAPLILPLLLVWLLPYNNFLLNAVLMLIFLACGATDFLDGYLARRNNQESELGKMLDPIADKLFVCSVLIALLAAGKIAFMWVILLIGRELFIMGLRQVTAVPVSYFGKCKTVLQIAALAIIIVNPYQNLAGHFIGINGLELGLLVTAVGASWYSAWHYGAEYLCLFKN